MFESLCVLAVLLSVWLIACGIDEVIVQDEFITDERREKYRQIAYAAKNRERTKKQNREKLWEEMQ